MDKDFLFLKTLEDLENKIKSKDAYEIFMAAGLLRKLLVDRSPLIDQVNKNRKLKILFTVNDRPVPAGDSSLEFWSIEDGFDPETSVPHLSKPIQVKRDQLLKRTIMLYRGETIKVLDLIKFISNVQGAIHTGKVKKDKEEVLKEMQSYFSIGGLPAGVRILTAISRVVLKGLEPLRESIKTTRVS